MAEAAQAQASAAISPDRDIKEEPNALDHFDFSMAQPNGSPELPPEPVTEPAPDGTPTPAPTATPTPTPAAAAAPSQAPESPTKRPIEDVETTIETPEAKRLKTEEQHDAPQPEQPEAQSQPPDDNYDEQMNLLVQNALSNINDMMDQFDPESEDRNEANGDANADETEPISFIDEPSKFTHNQFINALGNTAVATLLLLSQKPHDDIVAKLRDADSEHRRRYNQYQKSLEALRLHYSDRLILLASDYDLQSDMAGTIIQFVNLAQLGAWLLDGSPDSVCEADKNLPKVFRDERLGLAQNIVSLMTGIKTQRTINLVQSKDDKKLSEEELQGIFLESAEKDLEEHGITNLVHDSEKTITSCLSERVEELRNLTAETNIAEKYSTAELLRTFCAYANNQLALAEQLSEKLGFTRPKFEEPAEDNEPTAEDLLDFASFFEKNTEEMIQNTLAGLEDLPPPAPAVTNGDVPNPPTVNGATTQQTEVPKPNGSITDYKDFEALIAESTSNYVKNTLNGLSPTPYQPTVPTSTTESMAAQVQHANHLNSTQQQAPNSYYQSYPQPTTEQQQQQHLQIPEQQPQQNPGQGLPPNQTCSSAQLYEKARQAALSRNTAHTRREGLHSTRRPWSQEEEKALMTGLDMVKGPHWSQILSLFGINGSITDILRDRTQVQLKDKARNLKLFFLKTNSEMPYYLNSVTGELKTRAPTQAARKEAEERARQTSVEDQTKLQSIMAMSNGLQHSPQHRTHAGGVITPAQAAAQAAASAQNRAHVQSSPPQMTYTAPTQGAIPTTPATSSQHQTQGYGAQPGTQGTQAQGQPQIPRPQHPSATNGSHGSPAGHSDQPVKHESQQQSQGYDQQALVEQLHRLTQDSASTPSMPQHSQPSQQFSSPAQANTPGGQQSPALSATTTTTPSHPQPQQQHVPTPARSHQASQSPAPAQTAPSSSSTPAPPAPALAFPTAASAPAAASEQPTPTTEHPSSAPQIDMEPPTSGLEGFDADAEAALLRDLQAAMIEG